MKKAVDALKSYLIRIPYVKRQVEELAHLNHIKRGGRPGLDKLNWVEAENTFYSAFFIRNIFYPLLVVILLFVSISLYETTRPYDICLSKSAVKGGKLSCNNFISFPKEGNLRIGIINENTRSVKSSLVYLYFPQGVEVKPVVSRRGPNWDCWQADRVYFMELPSGYDHRYVNVLKPLHVRFPCEGVYYLRCSILGEDSVTVTRMIRVRVK